MMVQRLCLVKDPLSRFLWSWAWRYARRQGLGIKDIDGATPLYLKKAIECRVLRDLARGTHMKKYTEKILEASRALTSAYIESCKLFGGQPQKDDPEINEASRKLIQVYTEEYNAAHIGKFVKPFLTPVKLGDTIHKGGCDFVLPCYDAELDNMLRNRNATRGQKTLIEDKIRDLGGLPVLWV